MPVTVQFRSTNLNHNHKNNPLASNRPRIRTMKIETLLDTPSILANRGTPVHLALRFTAPAVESGRSRPIAFCVVLDRSGSMHGQPLEQAKEATRRVIRNLRRDDRFALVIFDEQAQTLLPLQAVGDRESALRAVDRIRCGGSTNLTGGWMLGRDALKAAPEGMPRKILLLSDGMLNMGITDPEQVRQIAAQGLEQHSIRTSTLGFGEQYQEDVMVAIAETTGGTFYDARNADLLARIFAVELEGLQALAVQNLRVRSRRRDFCERALLLSAYPMVSLPEGGSEVTVGDLVSEEQRTLVLALEVLPIPPLPDGSPAASLEGEELLECEVLWDALQGDGVASHREVRTIRILPVQDEKDVVRNTEIIPFVAAQQAGRCVREAIDRLDRGEVKNAIEGLKDAIRRIEAYGTGADLTDALRTLHNTLRNIDIDTGWVNEDSRKVSFFRAYSSSKMSSAMYDASADLDEVPSWLRQKKKQIDDAESGGGEGG